MSVLIFSLQRHYEEALWDLCTDSCARTTQTHKPNGPAWMKPHCRLRSFWIASYSLRVLAPQFQFQHFHLEIWQLLPQVQKSIWIHSYLLSLQMLYWELCRVCVALHMALNGFWRCEQTSLPLHKCPHVSARNSEPTLPLIEVAQKRTSSHSQSETGVKRWMAGFSAACHSRESIRHKKAWQ